MNRQMPMRPGAETESCHERVLERGFHPSGALAYERVTVRTLPQAATAPVRDPLWLDALVWVIAAFWRGLELLGEALLAIVMVILGLVGGVVAVALAVGLAIGLVAAGYWIGTAINGETGGMIGSAIAAAVVLLTVVGAANRDRR